MPLFQLEQTLPHTFLPFLNPLNLSFHALLDPSFSFMPRESDEGPQIAFRRPPHFVVRASDSGRGRDRPLHLGAGRSAGAGDVIIRARAFEL